MQTNRINSDSLTALRSRILNPGMYAPVPTFFFPESEDLDLPTLQVHVVRMANAGVCPLVAGTMGEAIHLTHAERTAIIKATREALDDAGFTDTPIIAGSGTGSTRETVELSKEAAQAGADYVIVIAPGYFGGTIGADRKALKAFWSEVSEKSPVPVIIYNFPGVTGIDLDSDIIKEMARDCPNIVGVKLTCGNVGKLTRICAETSSTSFLSTYPRRIPDAGFLVLGGMTDFVVPSSFVNGSGAITGLCNVAPYTTAKLYELSEASKKDLSLLPEANRVQGIVANADYTIAKTSIAGTKFLLEKLYGYGGLPRRPLPPIDKDVAEALWEHPHVQELVKLERKLSGTG